MTPRHAHPIGTPGQPWGEAERSLWRSRQRRQRSYAGDVLEAVAHLHAHWDVQPYGELDYAPDFYPLVALHSADWSHDRPIALVTGGTSSAGIPPRSTRTGPSARTARRWSRSR